MQTEYCNYTLTGQTHYSSGLFRNPANTMNTKSNEELLELIYDGIQGEYALEQLIANLRPMMIKIGYMHLRKIPIYDEDDYVQEGSIVLWTLIQSRKYDSRGKFSTLFYTAFDRKCTNLYRDYVLKNLIQLAEQEDLYHYGYHTTTFAEDAYAEKYREQHREHCRRWYEANRQTEPSTPRIKLTEEERKERARQRSREYYQKNKEKCRAAKRKWYSENREYALAYQRAYEQGVRIGQKGPAKKRGKLGK